MWTPVNKTTSRQGRQVRLYAGQKNALLDGKWHDIASNIDITHNNGTFRVAFRNKWIYFIPTTPLVVKRIVIDGSRFGPIINATTKPDFVEYSVTHSAGVKLVEAGWEICDGVGIYLDDWFKNFPGAVNLQSDKVILDLSAAVADENGEINLDPVTIPFSKLSRWFKGTNVGSGWPVVLDSESSSNGPENQLLVRAQTVEDDPDPDLDDYRNWRSGLRFDTSAYSRVSLVQLVLKQIDANGANVDPHAVFVGNDGFDDAAGAITPMANYKIIRDGGFQEGTRTPVQLTLNGTTWTSADLSADYVATAKFDLGLYCNHHDGAGRNAPGLAGDTNDVVWNHDGANAPFLLVTLAAPSATSTATTTTRRSL